MKNLLGVIVVGLAVATFTAMLAFGPALLANSGAGNALASRGLGPGWSCPAMTKGACVRVDMARGPAPVQAVRP